MPDLVRTGQLCSNSTVSRQLCTGLQLLQLVQLLSNGVVEEGVVVLVVVELVVIVLVVLSVVIPAVVVVFVVAVAVLSIEDTLEFVKVELRVTVFVLVDHRPVSANIIVSIMIIISIVVRSNFGSSDAKWCRREWPSG